MSTFSKFLELISGTPTTIDLANAGNALGVANMQLLGSTSGILTHNAAATTTPYTLIWPAAQGSANQVLAQSGTPGTLAWTTLTSGITQLTGDVTAGPGSGSQVASLVATSNATLTTLSALTTASALASVGTITSGTWNATTIAIVHGGTGVTSATTVPAPSSFAAWDTNKNLSANSFIAGYSTTAAVGGNTTLTASSTQQQYFTGTVASIVTMPVTSTLVLGQSFTIVNNTTASLTVNSSGGNAIQVMGASSQAILTVVSTSLTTAAAWNVEYSSSIGGSGTVTSVTFTGDGTVLSSTPSSAVTTSGTLTATLNPQNANFILAGPTTGAPAAPTFRSLVGADLPLPSASSLGGIESYSAVAHQWINAISTSGVPSSTQPAFTDISGSVAASQMPALTGDVTTTAGTVATSLVATSNATLTTLSALTTASALASVGTITSGTWNATTIAIAHGGTGQTSASAAFNALSPITSTGDLIVGTGTNTAGRVAIGSTGQVLTVVGGTAAWASPGAVTITATYTGSTLTANTTYALRWGVAANSETAGNLYVADWAVNSNEYWVVGLYNSTSSTTSGSTITITNRGSFTLGSSDTNFISGDQGKPVWLGVAGAYIGNTGFAPSGGDANVKMGIVQTATKIWIDVQMMGIS